MNNLLFTALIIALLYYFCYYLPSQKKLNANPPLKHHQFTQTEALVSNNHADLPSAQFIPDPEQIKKLQKENQEKDKKLKELSEVETILDQLLKGIQDLNNEL